MEKLNVNGNNKKSESDERVNKIDSFSNQNSIKDIKQEIAERFKENCKLFFNQLKFGCGRKFCYNKFCFKNSSKIILII
jgi:hypothetical protein